MKYNALFLSVFFVNFVFSEDCKEIRSKSPIMRIKKYLFCNYDGDEPPSNEHGNGTSILFGMIPRMANFDEITDNLEIHSLVYMSWTDERLTWNSTLFDNTTGIFMPSWRLWAPKISVHSHGGGSVNTHHENDCHLHHADGMVTCVPSISYTTRCKTDFTLWPYDRQNCTLVLGSWSLTGDTIAFKDKLFPPIHMDYFMSNGEWHVVGSRASYDEKQSHHFENMTTPIVSIDFILDRVHNQIRRVYVTPGIILIMMTLTTLWLDPRSIERLSVACLNPVIHLLCIQNLHWALPHNGPTIPYILLFYINSFILATIALVLTFALRKIHNIKKSPPKWISGSAGLMLRSKIGQILLLSMLDPKASAGMENDADDNGELVGTHSGESAWGYVTILIGWIAFVGIFIAYIFMYSHYMPNSSMKPPLDTLDIL